MATTQTTTNTTSTTYLNKQFYDRKMLEYAKTQFVYANFGQKRSIPKNNGKSVEFRRWNLFTPDLGTNDGTSGSTGLRLTEGVTPTSLSLSQSKVEATVEQFGCFVEVSDYLDLTAYDPVISDSAELLGENIGTALDWITRDAMLAGASVQYAGGKTSKNTLTLADSKMTIAEIRKAVRTLNKAKARKFTNGGKPHYVCIVDPDVVYDLQSDQNWLDVQKYQNAEAIYNGELGRMYGVVFVESTEGKVDKQKVLSTLQAASSSATSVLFTSGKAPTDAEVIKWLNSGTAKLKTGTITLEISAYDSATGTMTVTAISSAISAGDIVYSDDAGAPDASTKAAPDVHHNVIFGADAYGIIDISGQGAVQSIIKPAGSAGTADPLNQRSTVACKVMAYTACVLNSNWIIDIMSCAS